MKTTLKLVSPTDSFLLGSSTSFAGLELPSAFGLVTTGYHNGDYSLSTASWNIGLTVCILKSDGTQLDIPEGVLAVLPEVPEVKIQGPVIRIPAKSLILREDDNDLSILSDTDDQLFKITLNGHFAYMVMNSETPAKLTEWNYLMQAASALKGIVDAGVGKSSQEQEQLLLDYHSELERIITGFGNLCDSLKAPRMQNIRVYRLAITALGKTVSQYMYQKESDDTDVEPLFEKAFRDSFPEISALSIFLRQLDFLENCTYGIEVDVDYMKTRTYLHFSLQRSTVMLPERAASALSLSTVFQA